MKYSRLPSTRFLGRCHIHMKIHTSTINQSHHKIHTVLTLNREWDLSGYSIKNQQQRPSQIQGR